ncbi:MAG: proteasome subunit beta, partial [Candidatus Methylomirabilis sp.]|nr:proteasome subunit beta [Deltaproteobacteria bacterium]
EKIEGVRLGLEGKANRLGAMIRQNLPMAMQGLVVVPIFAGYDLNLGKGRIFKYDVTGGRYEDTEYYATGSGGKDARNSLKKLYRGGLSLSDAVSVAVEALFDAADDDRATGGPDLMRGIYPTIKAVTREGLANVEESKVKAAVEAVIARRKERNGVAA